MAKNAHSRLVIGLCPLALLFAAAWVVASTGCNSSDDTDREISSDPSPFQFGEVKNDPQVAPVSQKPATVKFTRLTMPEPFVYENGEQGQSLMVETVGGGCGWLDDGSIHHSDQGPSSPLHFIGRIQSCLAMHYTLETEIEQSGT